MCDESPVVVGIDVGGCIKGFHAVALRDSQIIDKLHSTVPQEIVDFCLAVDAQVIGVDCPCRWRTQADEPRESERALGRDKISCFSTPTEAKAKSHPKNHYGWMKNGRKLYDLVEKTHDLYIGNVGKGKLVFETYPQAVACKLAGEIISAKQKSQNRRPLLEKANINTKELTNQDWIDAALCALTAQFLLRGEKHLYGDATTGFIVVPRI